MPLITLSVLLGVSVAFLAWTIGCRAAGAVVAMQSFMFLVALHVASIKLRLLRIILFVYLYRSVPHCKQQPQP